MTTSIVQVEKRKGESNRSKFMQFVKDSFISLIPKSTLFSLHHGEVSSGMKVVSYRNCWIALYWWLCIRIGREGHVKI